MDTQERSPATLKEAKDFEPQHHFTPLESSAISASVNLLIGGKPVLIGEGKEATTIDDLAQAHPELLAIPAGVINGARTLEDVNSVRASKGTVDSYLGIYGPKVMLDMMMGKLSGGLVVRPITEGDKPRLEVFLKDSGGFVQTPPDLTGNFPNLIEFSGTQTIQDPTGADMTVIIYSTKR